MLLSFGVHRVTRTYAFSLSVYLRSDPSQLFHYLSSVFFNCIHRDVTAQAIKPKRGGASDSKHPDLYYLYNLRIVKKKHLMLVLTPSNYEWYLNLVSNFILFVRKNYE